MDHISNGANLATSLQRFGILEYFDVDQRPTFIVDSWTQEDKEGPYLKPVYYNMALLEDDLTDAVTGQSLDAEAPGAVSDKFSSFKSWVSLGRCEDLPSSTLHYEGVLWSRSSLKDRWIVISGVYSLDRAENVESRSSRTWNTDRTKAAMMPQDGVKSVPTRLRNQLPARYTSPKKQGTTGPTRLRASVGFDWTASKMPPKASPFLKYARSIDWANTSLGPMEGWSSQLRMMCNVVVCSQSLLRFHCR